MKFLFIIIFVYWVRKEQFGPYRRIIEQGEIFSTKIFMYKGVIGQEKGRDETLKTFLFCELSVHLHMLIKSQM